MRASSGLDAGLGNAIREDALAVPRYLADGLVLNSGNRQKQNDAAGVWPTVYR